MKFINNKTKAVSILSSFLACLLLTLSVSAEVAVIVNTNNNATISEKDINRLFLR